MEGERGNFFVGQCEVQKGQHRGDRSYVWAKSEQTNEENTGGWLCIYIFWNTEG